MVQPNDIFLYLCSTVYSVNKTLVYLQFHSYDYANSVLSDDL